jgi:hypothetical protein
LNGANERGSVGIDLRQVIGYTHIGHETEGVRAFSIPR